jgi:hypothetical protein
VASKKPSNQVLHKQWLKEHGQECRERLLRNIKAQLPQLKKLLREVDAGLRSKKGEDQSGDISVRTVQWQQAMAQKVCSELQNLQPDRPLRTSFRRAVAEATRQEIDSAASPVQETRVISAFLLAQFLLELACKKGGELKTLPDESDDDWGALLKLFDLQ